MLTKFTLPESQIILSERFSEVDSAFLELRVIRGFYIGGFSSDFSINTVTNTNLADEQSTANYAANGIVQGDGNFEFECREHGLIIGVTYTLPFIDYDVIGYDSPVLRTQFSDFALPEYDKLGYESVDPRLLCGDLYNGYLNGSPVSSLGYGPRYYDYKTN